MQVKVRPQQFTAFDALHSHFKSIRTYSGCNGSYPGVLQSSSIQRFAPLIIITRWRLLRIVLPSIAAFHPTKILRHYHRNDIPLSFLHNGTFPLHLQTITSLHIHFRIFVFEFRKCRTLSTGKCYVYFYQRFEGLYSARNLRNYAMGLRSLKDFSL